MLSAPAVVLSTFMAIVPSLTPPSGACVVEQVTIEWGFKESFRSYLSGAIALGTWTTKGDVGYETPVFIFSRGDGFLTPDRSAGEIAFEGEFRFEGHGGILNTTLANPRLQFVEEREAILFLDVSGDTMDGVTVERNDVDFVRVSWPSSAESIDADSGLMTITNAEVVLTDLGSEAFGTYLSGEVFDPMDISLQVPAGCLEDSGFRWWWIPGGITGLAVLAGALWAGITRANRSRGPERQ